MKRRPDGRKRGSTGGAEKGSRSMLMVGKPVEGMDLRDFGRVRVAPFLLRLVIGALLAAGAVALIVATRGLAAVAGMVVLGLLFAHAVELQHQTLHHTAFPSRPWN